MGVATSLSELLFGKADKAEEVQGAEYWKTFTEYAPQFSTFGGNLYEQALTRSVIERYAMACAKLDPQITGSAKPRLKKLIKSQPNSFMTWSAFLARIATILEMDTTAYVVPAFNENLQIVGLFPLKAESAEILLYKDEPWVRFQFATGDTSAIELRNVCILTKFQYTSDYFGEGNKAIESTLELLKTQEKAQANAVRNGADIRFLAKVTGQMHEDDLERKRELFSERNLSANNKSGLLMYDQTFDEVKQIEPQHYVMADGEMDRIRQNVFQYFGMNEQILTNSYTEETWGAYYEGKVEPFAIQLSEGLTNLLYTENERMRGNKITFSSNRLAYASNASKRNMCRDMTDRAVMMINEAREVLQLPPVEGGDVFMPRGEYNPRGGDGLPVGGKTNSKSKGDPNDPADYDRDVDPAEHDTNYKETDTKGEKDKDYGL